MPTRRTLSAEAKRLEERRRVDAFMAAHSKTKTTPPVTEEKKGFIGNVLSGRQALIDSLTKRKKK